MIKNAEHLSMDEMDSFRRSYKNYFINLNRVDSPDWGQRVDHMLDCLLSGDYVDTMLGRIKENKRLGFVYSNNDKVKGFIVGRLYDDEEGWISHFDVDTDLDPHFRQVVALELFKRMALEFKRYGKTSVATRSMYFNRDFINMIKNLGFTVQEEYEDGDIEYGRKL